LLGLLEPVAQQHGFELFGAFLNLRITLAAWSRLKLAKRKLFTRLQQ
jgi:hypothetical protein